MRFPVYSLRTGILVELAFLVAVAMMLVDVVMVKLNERNLLRARIQHAHLLAGALNAGLVDALSKGKDLSRIAYDDPSRRNVEEAAGALDPFLYVVFDASGAPVYEGGAARSGMAGEAIRPPGIGGRAGTAVRFSGRTWGVFWPAPRFLDVTVPLTNGGRPAGKTVLRLSLVPVYQQIREGQKAVFMYILLNSLVLTLAGGYLLSRMVLRPIRRLLRRTSEYKEGDFMPPFEISNNNEIGELSRSLNHMLKRLEQNKLQLEGHVRSLKRANEELQRAQEEIIRSEKLASVGRLAAGIAHEIGNPIGIVLGYIELLEKGTLSESEARDCLGRLQEETVRINGIIRQLLDFSRPSEGKRADVSVHGIVHKTLAILAPQPLLSDVEVLLELLAPEDHVLADPQQVQQVFLNILMNAADALSEKESGEPGEVTKTLVIRSENTDRTIRLAFIDNGVGMGQEALSRIFDPFYTTKEPGRGTGLGLSVSYKIIEGLGGRLEAESVPGEGTTLICDIPLRAR